MILDRQQHLDALTEAFEKVRSSGGHSVFVHGEAGIGKSTLVEQFLANISPDTSRAVALCDPLITPRPLGPVRDLEAALSQDHVSDSDETRYFDGFLRHLQTSQQPIILVVEDLHWVDQRSLDWLQFIGRRLSQLPVLLIGTYRDDEVDASHPLSTALGSLAAAKKTSIPLKPLSIEAIEKLAQDSTMQPAQLLDVTGGNPFFLTELLSHDGSGQHVPSSVSDAVNARLNGLSAAEQDFIEMISCCPGKIPFKMISSMPLGEVDAYCDDAVRRNFLVPSGPDFKFRHELARRATYERMAPAKRQKAHGLFLDALLSQDLTGDALEMVVHHAQGAHRDDLLVKYAPMAASKAAQLGSHREAAAHLACAMTLLEGQPPAFAAQICESWAYEAGLALAIDEDVIAARMRAVDLWKQVGDTERVGENLQSLSRLHWYRGEAELAQRLLLEAIDLLDDASMSPARAKAFGLRAQFFMLQDRMADAITWGQRALDLARLLDNAETIAHALNTIGTARMFRGDAAGEDQLRESLAISLAHDLHEQAARVYTNLSECLVEARALDTAAELVEEGIAFDTAHDLDSWTYYLVGRKAHLFFEMDRYSEALAIAQNVLTQQNQTLLMQMPAMIIQARAKQRLGEADASEALELALDAALKIDEPQYLVTLRIAQLEGAVLSGNTSAAKDALHWLGGLEADLSSPRKRGEYLFWANRLGQQIDTTQIDDLPPAFRQALTGTPDEASKAFEAEQSTYFSAWALSDAATPKAVKEAEKLFTKINANAARIALRKQLPEAGLAALGRGQYSAAKAHPYGLTKTEQKLLSLLAAGKSNSAMAQELSRSKRTIENHVSSILSKLRCENRLEVVLRVQSEGWILPDQTDNTLTDSAQI